ncbi:MAG: LysR family transcriptional regulator [Xanthobacteraceae bacterium]|nr:LysR family transcriptional regulator [Xanthobacteraceae bacterium]
MDLRQLRSLVHISDCGSLSRAAEIMRTSQPALSLQIKHLETELGVELLHRHARGVTLTDLGRLFCDHVRTILKDIERAKEIVSSQAKSPIGKVSVGLPTSACRGMSAQLIETVAKRFPNISLHIIEAMTGTLDEWVQLGRLDVALLYDHKAFPNVAWTEMMVEDFMLIAASNDPIGKRTSIRFLELENLRIVLPGSHHVLRNVIDRIAVREGVTPNVVIDSDSLTAISQLVRSGYMTIMPHFAFADEIARGEMNAVPIVDPTPSWRLSVVVSQRTINARSSEVIATALAEVIQSMVESGAWRARLRAQAA